jgi:hypothetical protein
MVSTTEPIHDQKTTVFVGRASRVEEDTMEQDKGYKGGEQKGKITFKEWWRDARPTKTVVFWS